MRPERALYALSNFSNINYLWALSSGLRYKAPCEASSARRSMRPTYCQANPGARPRQERVSDRLERSASRRGPRVDGRSIRSEQGPFDLSAVGVVTPRDPGRAEILSHRGFAFSIEIGLLDLMALRVIGARDSGRADPFALDGTAGGIEIGFDHLNTPFILSTRRAPGADRGLGFGGRLRLTPARDRKGGCGSRRSLLFHGNLRYLSEVETNWRPEGCR